MVLQLGNVHDSLDGFDKLAGLHGRMRGNRSHSFKIDMGQTDWFDANMCAVLGAVIHMSTRKNGNTVNLTNIPTKVLDALARNGFIQQYGDYSNYYNTTVAYRRFDFKTMPPLPGQARTALQHPIIDVFREHARAEFLRNPEITALSPPLFLHFSRNIFEMFDNAVVHSETVDGIFSCGQYFHNKRKLRFTIVDLGIGIGESVNKYFGTSLSSERAISKVVKGGITTKISTYNTAGGSGLRSLCDFVRSNKGDIRIMTKDCCWELTCNGEKTRKVSSAFPGTIVSLTLNTNQKPSDSRTNNY